MLFEEHANEIRGAECSKGNPHELAGKSLGFPIKVLERSPAGMRFDGKPLKVLGVETGKD